MDLLLDSMAREGFEQVVAIHDRWSGLRALLGIHDTRLGPAFGGIRRYHYRDEGEALRDCLRLSMAMTAKCAIAGLPAGGAKLVALEGPDVDWEGAYEHIGGVVESLGGRFYTGPDLGTGERELGWAARRTGFVTRPGAEGPGELAEATAEGVLAGIAAALRHLDGAEEWTRRRVVVQGLGAVGGRVAELLRERGVEVFGSDVDPERALAVAERLGIELVDPSRELDIPCDVLSPNAMGLVHDLTSTRLRCRVLAGGANNILAREEHADRLHERGILYAPDFVINSGALIRGATFHLEGRRLPVPEIGARIGRELERVLAAAAELSEPPARVAARMVEQRLAAAPPTPARAGAPGRAERDRRAGPAPLGSRA